MSAVNKVDRVIFSCVVLLLAISILMVFSTTAISARATYGNSTAMLSRHVVSIVLGVMLACLCFYLEITTWKRVAVVGLLASLILLFLVAIPGIGQQAGGARRWLGFGPLRFQPGEFAKLFALLYFASYIERHFAKMGEFFSGTVKPLFVLALFAGLLLLEPDFGTSVIIVSVVFLQLITASRIRHLFGLGFFVVCSAAVLVYTSPYRFKRVQSFLDPFGDSSASGYQLIQSLIAVGSGGVFGVGLGQSKQKLFYLPAAHTDFIFAVIAEELGFIGASFVLLCFMTIAFRGFRIALRLKDDRFLFTFAVGATALLVIPALLNMGVVLGLLPTKGLVLPLVGFGGTAMMVNLAVVGVLLRLSAIAAKVETPKLARRNTKQSPVNAADLRSKTAQYW